jgi:hypothetical protein
VRESVLCHVANAGHSRWKEPRWHQRNYEDRERQKAVREPVLKLLVVSVKGCAVAELNFYKTSPLRKSPISFGFVRRVGPLWPQPAPWRNAPLNGPRKYCG